MHLLLCGDMRLSKFPHVVAVCFIICLSPKLSYERQLTRAINSDGSPLQDIQQLRTGYGEHELKANGTIKADQQ